MPQSCTSSAPGVRVDLGVLVHTWNKWDSPRVVSCREPNLKMLNYRIICCGGNIAMHVQQMSVTLD